MAMQSHGLSKILELIGDKRRKFRTVARAQSHVRKSGNLKKQGITVHLKGGVYYLNDPIVFSEEDSGTPDAHVTYTAVKGAEVVISGGGSSLRLAGHPIGTAFIWLQYPPKSQVAKPGFKAGFLFSKH